MIWLSVTVLVILYAWAGYVASRTDTLSITLEPGYSTQVRVYRFAEDQLRLGLIFHDGNRARRGPELGSYRTRSDWRATGFLEFEDPGSAVHIVASMPSAAPVTYEALPSSARWASREKRELTPERSVSRGKWRWWPTSKGLALQPGLSIVNIEVAAVEQPLVGQSVDLTVHPALGFYNLMPNVGWLWPSLLWPLYVIALAFWAFVLRRQDQAQKP